MDILGYLLTKDRHFLELSKNRVAVKVEMADDYQEDKNYLPDLNNELAGKQIVLQIIAWFNLSPEHRAYPKSCLKNKNSWCKHMRKYSYNTDTGVL